MFKIILKIGLISMVLTGLAFANQDNSQNSIEQSIKERVAKRIKIEVNQNKSIIQKMVFDCDFYQATPYLRSADGGESSSESFLYYSHEQSLGLMTMPTSTEPLPELTFCLKPNFVVRDSEQAQLLFEAIETVYPSESMFDERFPKQLTQVENGWVFINGEFFDDKKGYIAETTSDGKVIKITRSLNL